jgi:hypothetical protein
MSSVVLTTRWIGIQSRRSGKYHLLGELEVKTMPLLVQIWNELLPLTRVDRIIPLLFSVISA